MTEVLRLRRGDVDAREGALRLTNLKQCRRALREKLVYVSPDLLRDPVLYAKDLRLGPGDHFFTSQKTDGPGEGGASMTRQHAWWLLRRAAEGAGRGCWPRVLAEGVYHRLGFREVTRVGLYVAAPAAGPP